MELSFRDANSSDLDKCAEIRGLTRDNPIGRDVLIAIGVTEEAWAPKVENGTYVGVVAEDQKNIIGYCFGDTQTGEVQVLAVLPKYEGLGVGSKLITVIAGKLFSTGLSSLWLAASPDPKIRAHGFYRHLGWQPTQDYDENGDELLRYKKI